MTKGIEKSFKNKLTKKDYFLYLINRNSFILLSPLIILALIVVFAFMVNKNGFSYNDLLYLLPILLFALSYIQIYNAINTAVKANKNSEDLKVILEQKRYKEVSSNGESSLEYNKFYSYYENKNYYYLYVDRINALIIPKREFDKNELNVIDGYFKGAITKTSKFNFKTIFGITLSIALLISIIFLITSMI
jgi:hypothetical protein